MSNRRREQGQGSMFQYPGCKRWVIQYYVDGVRKREATGLTSRQEAQKVLHARLTSVARGEPITIKAVRVSECYDALLQSEKYVDRPKKIAGLKMRWKNLEPTFGSLLASRVGSQAVKQYRAQRIATGVGHATVDRELAYLRAMLRHAFKSRLLATAPYIPMSGADNIRTGFVNDEKLDALKDAANCELWLRTVVELGATYGWRRDELLSLRVAQIDFASGVIRLEVGTTKNGDGREVPMTPTVHSLLEQCCTAKRPTDKVLTREDGTAVCDPRVAWWKLCCSVGLGHFVCQTNACGHTQASRARCPKCNLYNWQYRGLHVHDLRRTAVRNLRRAGVAEQVAMSITGHKTSSVFRRYDIVNNDDKRTALQQLQRATEFKVALKTSPQQQAGSTKVQ